MLFILVVIFCNKMLRWLRYLRDEDRWSDVCGLISLRFVQTGIRQSNQEQSVL